VLGGIGAAEPRVEHAMGIDHIGDTGGEGGGAGGEAVVLPETLDSRDVEAAEIFTQPAGKGGAPTVTAQTSWGEGLHGVGAVGEPGRGGVVETGDGDLVAEGLLCARKDINRRGDAPAGGISEWMVLRIFMQSGDGWGGWRTSEGERKEKSHAGPAVRARW